jgi:hypothetical protein
VIQQTVPALAELYEADETAWLEAMAELIREGRLADLDYPHLQEYLTDMAGRDRREVKSRLVVLLTHLLKWAHQQDHRSRSWRTTILNQRYELADLAEKGVLRNHAEAVLTEAYTRALKLAASETGLPVETFSGECPYTVDQLLSPDLLGEQT